VADLVVVQAETPAEAVVNRPVRELVLARGQVVARGNALAPLLQSHLSTPQARSSAG
jgi:hypothetical protein